MKTDFPQKHSHELVLFFYPSPGLDWSSPRALALTTARNRLLGLSRGIGHVSVMVRTPERELLTGMTQSRPNEGRREVLFDGYGLGILLHSFGGTLEKSEKLWPELLSRSRSSGKLSYLRVLINGEIGARLFQYFDEYEQRGFACTYGMRNRPRHGEGGGCSAFGASFLEVGGLLREDYAKSWTRNFLIPRSLIGGPSTGVRVPFWKLLRDAGRWASLEEGHETGFFWDPDLMHRWVESFTDETWNQARGICRDERTGRPPDEPIFNSSASPRLGPKQ